MKNQMKKRIIILCEILVVLFPFLVISFFTYPVADDYNYGKEVYHVWVAEHNRSVDSILYLLKHALSVTYTDWQFGRSEYSSFFFSSLMPSAWGGAHNMD